MKIRLATLFSGYDSQALAMERLKRDFPNFDYELVAWCEIDDMAIHAHNALLPKWKDRNMGDICKVNPEDFPDCDVATWSFPCQDISSAGKQRGLAQDSGSRSSLAWETIRIFKAKRPKYMLMENVKALTQKKFIPDFVRLQKALEEIGYTNFWQVMNAKDYGIPQNRERVFMVSILNADHGFNFPKPFPLEKRLKDVLEDNVDESYYLKDEQVARILEHCDRKVADGCGFRPNFAMEDDVSGTLTGYYGQRETDTYLKIIGYTRDSKGNVQNYHENELANTLHTSTGSGGNTDQFVKECIQVAQIYDQEQNPINGRVYDADGICPTLRTPRGGLSEPKIIQKVGDRGTDNYSCKSISNTIPANPMSDREQLLVEPKILTPIRTDEQRELRKQGIDTFGGRQMVPRADGVCNTLTSVQKDNLLQEPCYRIRKLTPRECFRLMDVYDSDIDKIDAYRIKTTLKNGTTKEKPISKSAKYKLAGNSIVVSCLYYIFKSMFIDEKPKKEPKQLTLFD